MRAAEDACDEGHIPALRQRQSSVILVDETSYIIRTVYAWEKPQLTDDELTGVAKIIVGRL